MKKWPMDQIFGQTRFSILKFPKSPVGQILHYPPETGPSPPATWPHLHAAATGTPRPSPPRAALCQGAWNCGFENWLFLPCLHPCSPSCSSPSLSSLLCSFLSSLGLLLPLLLAILTTLLSKPSFHNTFENWSFWAWIMRFGFCCPNIPSKWGFRGRRHRGRRAAGNAENPEFNSE